MEGENRRAGLAEYTLRLRQGTGQKQFLKRLFEEHFNAGKNPRITDHSAKGHSYGTVQFGDSRLRVSIRESGDGTHKLMMSGPQLPARPAGGCWAGHEIIGERRYSPEEAEKQCDLWQKNRAALMREGRENHSGNRIRVPPDTKSPRSLIGPDGKPIRPTLFDGMHRELTNHHLRAERRR
jgi:hypothetical protein